MHGSSATNFNIKSRREGQYRTNLAMTSELVLGGTIGGGARRDGSFDPSATATSGTFGAGGFGNTGQGGFSGAQQGAGGAQVPHFGTGEYQPTFQSRISRNRAQAPKGMSTDTGASLDATVRQKPSFQARGGGNDDDFNNHTFYMQQPAGSQQYGDDQDAPYRGGADGGSGLKKLLPPRIRNGQVKDSPQLKVPTSDEKPKINVQRENIFGGAETSAFGGIGMAGSSQQNFKPVQPLQQQQQQQQQQQYQQQQQAPLVLKDQFELREQFVKEKFLQKERERQEQERAEKEREERERQARAQQQLEKERELQTAMQKKQQHAESAAGAAAQSQAPQAARLPPKPIAPPTEKAPQGSGSKALPELGAYVPNALEKGAARGRGRSNSNHQDSLGGNGAKRLGSVAQHEEKVAVATGVQEAPIEESFAEQVDLVPCPEGCGRSFHPKALEKHVQVCKKVFQQKRAEFNTQQKRVIDAEQSKLQRQAKLKEKIEKKQSKSKDVRTTQSNWKEQSEELRKIAKKQADKKAEEQKN